jgi:hypothetical protein
MNGAGLLSELDSQELAVPVADAKADVPTVTCHHDDHDTGPIREGSRTVVLFTRTAGGTWIVERTFCAECPVLDAYTELEKNRATAVVEGVMTPSDPFGSSDAAYLLDAFLWELYEPNRAPA